MEQGHNHGHIALNEEPPSATPVQGNDTFCAAAQSRASLPRLRYSRSFPGFSLLQPKGLDVGLVTQDVDTDIRQNEKNMQINGQSNCNGTPHESGNGNGGHS